MPYHTGGERTHTLGRFLEPRLSKHTGAHTQTVHDQNVLALETCPGNISVDVSVVVLSTTSPLSRKEASMIIPRGCGVLSHGVMVGYGGTKEVRTRKFEMGALLSRAAPVEGEIRPAALNRG